MDSKPFAQLVSSQASASVSFSMTEHNEGRNDNLNLLVDGAETLRRALVAAALRAYEDAGLAGLCPDGRWEAAVGAMRALDLHAIEVKTQISDAATSPRTTGGPHTSPENPNPD